MACPRCATVSARVHGRYRRRLVDTALGGLGVVVELVVRRFRCAEAGCVVVTFAEQVEGLTSPYARFTPPAAGALREIGLALAGRAGARLAAALGLEVGRDTLLRRVRALPDPEVTTIVVLGVDDFALRRGRTYGTVLIDVATGRPVDLLADREAETFAAWLKAHPGTGTVCRDRGGAYADGARTGAPEAVQIADRWHLWHNLAGYVEKTVTRHRADLREPAAEPAPSPEPEQADAEARAAAVRAEQFEQKDFVRHARERYAAVQELKAQGLGIKTIKRELGLAKETVRKYYRAETVEDVLARAREGRVSVLDVHKPYLHERFNAGVTTFSELFREISERGYTGSYATLRDYLRPLRAAGRAPAPAPAAPKVRTVTRWILTHPDRLDADDTATLKTILERSPSLAATAAHVAAFAQMLVERHGDRLDAWISAVEADDQPDLHRFTHGLRRDHAAVLAGLTEPHSSGVVEGNVNRIKMIKRQMYGRASFDLLRKRVLLAR
ncbi:ISL3 family transposase [Frankia sp. R82]|nr:ISL3 family transposase [Frankia sp. R82]